MRLLAILYIVLSVAANFIFDNPTSFGLAILSYPILLWVLLQRKRKDKQPHPNVQNNIEEKQRL